MRTIIRKKKNKDKVGKKHVREEIGYRDATLVMCFIFVINTNINHIVNG